MVKVLDLPHGWEVWADPDSGDPRFKKNGSGWRHAFEVASCASRDEAVAVYRVCKRWLDLADNEAKGMGAVLKYRAMDRAVMGLGFSLRMVNRWDDTLRQVDHVPMGAF